MEFLLFCLGWVMIIPPVPSDAGQTYSLIPVLVIGGGAYAASLLLGYRRGAEHWAIAGLKLLFYAGLAWVIHQRVFF